MHGIPLDTIGRLHDGVGRIGLLIECAVVPEGISAIRGTGFDHAVADGTKHRALLGIGEGGCDQRCFRISTIGGSTGIAGRIVSVDRIAPN